MKYYGHSLPGKLPDEWQPLADHLRAVADEAARFAEPFNSSEWARLAGTLHDLGKACNGFQAYLMRENDLGDADYDSADKPSSHSGAGAEYAIQRYGNAALLLAYIIMGHHAGLPDWVGGVAPAGSLSARREAARHELQLVNTAELNLALPPELPPPAFPMRRQEAHLWIRMLFSCLVDADFLDTERFMDPQKFAERRSYPALGELVQPFFSKLDQMQRVARSTSVNQIRAEIRRACEDAASLPPGVFSLTVPTGGGKTLSGTAFALRHSQKHGKRRIIYVIPYTSIIEQTADTLRTHFGNVNVVEHHSNLEPETRDKAAKLAAENWDAPIIVTTSVQFFESLMAAKPSRCRKLHNIVNSVVILDEVQLLPPELLTVCTDLLRQLVDRYAVTLVLSTATQPALKQLEPVTEIIPAAMKLGQRLQRVNYSLPDVRQNERKTWLELADELVRYPQVLCIVNSRRDCMELFQKMPEGTIHLSGTMCGKHRSDTIERIKTSLDNCDPIRVVSTQLVEAGVDIDFPVVYRALAGLDSLAQSAGRCNREGGQSRGGRVVVFIPTRPAPKGMLRKAEDAARSLLVGPIDMHNPAAYRLYFEHFYSRVEDRYPYEELLLTNARSFEFQFREAATAFRMIDEDQRPIFVRYEEGSTLVDELRCTMLAKRPYGYLLRDLQRYVITVARGQAAKLLAIGAIEEHGDGICIWNSHYNKISGAAIFAGDAPLPPQDLNT